MSVDTPNPGATPVSAPKTTSSLGVVAFVLSVLGFVIGLVPFVALIFVLPGLVLGLMVLFKKDVAKDLAIAAVILASIGLLTNVIVDGVVLYVASTSDDVVAEIADSRPTPSPTAVETPASIGIRGEAVARKNAVWKAESYLDWGPFSRSKLIEQLEYHGFTRADAEYAVDTLKVDWNEQATKLATTYLKFNSFSRSELIAKLEENGYTTEQATYGVDQVGL